MRFKRGKLGNRILASFMALLMVFTIMPGNGYVTLAAETG